MRNVLLAVAAVGAAITLYGFTLPARLPVVDPFADARAVVVASLKDPDSARFGAFARGKGSSVCGEINARNSFGGYTGPRAFVYSPDGPLADMLYIDSAASDWDARGIMAEIFAARGCSIGADQARALEVRKALADSDRRMAKWESEK